MTSSGINATTWRNQENQQTIYNWWYQSCVEPPGENFGLKQVDHLSLLIEPWWLIGQPKNQRWTSALWLVSGMTSSPWGLTFERIRSNPCSMKTSKRMCHPSSLRCWGQSCYAVVLSLPSPSHQWTLCGNRSNCFTRRRRGNPILLKSLGIAGTSESSSSW